MAPLFFRNVRRGSQVIWGSIDNSPQVVNWSGFSEAERAYIIPELRATDNRGLLTHPLGPAMSITPPFPLGAQRILLAKGNASREKRWWKTGTDKLASHGLDTEVWVSINYHTPND